MGHRRAAHAAARRTRLVQQGRGLTGDCAVHESRVTADWCRVGCHARSQDSGARALWAVPRCGAHEPVRLRRRSAVPTSDHRAGVRRSTRGNITKYRHRTTSWTPASHRGSSTSGSQGSSAKCGGPRRSRCSTSDETTGTWWVSSIWARSTNRPCERIRDLTTAWERPTMAVR